jgi:hypothetical protein
VERGDPRFLARLFQRIAGFPQQIGISMAASGSVQATNKRSPTALPASALRVRSTGSGHLRPRRSKIFSAINEGQREGRQIRAPSLS